MIAASRRGLTALLFMVWAIMPPAQARPARPVSDIEEGRSAAGELTAAEDRIQGRWQAYIYGSSAKAWLISFDQRQFRADGEAGDWYVGRVGVRDDVVPAELDFVIEDCECKYKGMTSQGIFRWEGESLVMAAPEPGADRPTEFDKSSGEMVELRRAVARPGP